MTSATITPDSVEAAWAQLRTTPDSPRRGNLAITIFKDAKNIIDTTTDEAVVTRMTNVRSDIGVVCFDMRPASKQRKPVPVCETAAQVEAAYQEISLEVAGSVTGARLVDVFKYSKAVMAANPTDANVQARMKAVQAAIEAKVIE